jgi:hypothetical protein
VPGFEDQLRGAKAGDHHTVTITFPDDYGAEELRGKTAEFDVTVNEVKRKELPELDDDFASDAAGFDTLDELREDIAAKLREADEQRVEGEFREAVLDAVVRDATVDVPESLVEARARELWERMLHSLGHQGISREAYLRIAGQDEEQIIAEARPDAEQALRREAVIATASRRRAAWTSWSTTSPSARPSTCWPSTPRRSPSIRRAPATSCGRRARTRRRRHRAAASSSGPPARDASDTPLRAEGRTAEGPKSRLVGSPQPPPELPLRRQESGSTSETERGP